MILSAILKFLPFSAYPLLIAPLALSSMLCAHKTQRPTKNIQRDYRLPINVLLHEEPTITKTRHTISCPNGFLLSTPDDPGHKQWKYHKISIAINSNGIYLQCSNKKYRKLKSTTIILQPCNGSLSFDNNTYQGKLKVHLDKPNKTFMLINRVRLDDYIYAVLRYESLSFWPLEVQKVQAVASRTYALYQIQQQRKKIQRQPYDIKNTNFHQVYQGHHDSTHLRQAVNETRNMVLTYDNKIALTMFDINCGGLIPSKMKYADKKKPYLYRTYRCTYCKKKQYFNWEEVIKEQALLERLKSHKKINPLLKDFQYITKIKVTEKDDAGLAYMLKINDRHRKALISMGDIKKSFNGQLKSRALQVKKDKNNIVLTGYGYGHNMGLCQLGSRELVRRGWSFKKILAFYYPDTKLERLKKGA